MSVTVAIVEDDAQLRAAIVELINASEGLTCVGSYGSTEAALAALPGVAPHVVLMDINLGGLSGIEGTRRLKAGSPATHVVMLTSFDDSDLIFESLKAGATGYVLKRTPTPQILAAIHDVCAGGAPMSGVIAHKVVQYFRHNQSAPEVQHLTDREREVLDALAEGQQYKEIAHHLSISINTVRKYIKGIYEKLHVNTRADAVRKLGRV
ncbi:response regulator transcription factor [Luteitalea sp.]|uniref:response regulator transcription factor n=1 Tax=Luteitalea sp. TaxID=2004800 RepID=UPI0025BA6D17|nr:response regulator transcription factor [Luteitalea sp.]